MALFYNAKTFHYGKAKCLVLSLGLLQIASLISNTISCYELFITHDKSCIIKFKCKQYIFKFMYAVF